MSEFRPRLNPYSSSPDPTTSGEHGTSTIASKYDQPNVNRQEQNFRSSKTHRPSQRPKIYHTRKRSANNDEFDGPSHFLSRPSQQTLDRTGLPFPDLPTKLSVQEQEEILREIEDRLSQCAFTFIGHYEFPVPIEPDRGHPQRASDRRWHEWAHLLKRLATKRRVPKAFLFEQQIHNMVTILENSVQPRPKKDDTQPQLRDDYHILQAISAAIQVAKLLQDGGTMICLHHLYKRTEVTVLSRRGWSLQAGSL